MNYDTEEEGTRLIKELQGNVQAKSRNSKAINEKFFSWS
jgi:hypothetical protein